MRLSLEAVVCGTDGSAVGGLALSTLLRTKKFT